MPSAVQHPTPASLVKAEVSDDKIVAQGATGVAKDTPIDLTANSDATSTSSKKASLNMEARRRFVTKRTREFVIRKPLRTHFKGG